MRRPSDQWHCGGTGVFDRQIGVPSGLGVTLSPWRRAIASAIHSVSSSDTPHASSLAIRFLQRFLQDRAEGTVRTLTDYQGLFPGSPDIIATEYESVMAEAPAASDGPLSYPAQGSRYREEETIGRGGMGTVLRVFDPSLEREVAMKRLSDSKDRLPDAQRLGRFLDEAKVTGQLQHPGIVSVLEIGLDAEQRPYFTMPLIEGRSLQELIKAMHAGDAEWPEVRLLQAMARVCEAVAYAHERGVIHRDLKPANVMIGRFGETYVVDWGLAHDLARPDRRDICVNDDPDATDSALRTMAGDVIGTPAYMAPEQARGASNEVDRRSDVYSLGAMLYHLLVGSPPYLESGSHQSSHETLKQVLSGPPRNLTTAAPNARPELASICERAMAQDPASRYASAEDLGTDLRAFLENRVVLAHATGPIASMRKWVRRNRALALACMASVLALTAALAWSEMQRHKADANAGLANENLDLAFAAGDDLLGAFGSDDLSTAPGSDPLRTAVLERGLAYYEHLRDLRGNDSRVDRYVARARYRIADLKMRLGRAAEAKAAWRAAEAATATAIAKHGATPELQLQLIKIQAKEPVMLMQAGDVKAAVPVLEDAFRAITEHRQTHPDSHDALRTQVAYATRLAIGMAHLRSRKGALKYSAASLAASRELIAATPDEVAARALHGSVLTQRGKLMWQLGDIDQANAHYDEAAAVLDQTLGDFPDHRGVQSWFGDLLNLRGVLRMQQGDQSGAQEVFERARLIYAKLVAAHPGVRNFHGQLGGLLCNLGIIRALQHDHEAAFEHLTAAMQQLDRCLKIDPDALDYRDYHNIASQELAMLHLAKSHHADAAALTRKWVQGAPQGNRYAAGRLMALCAASCMADLAIAADERATLGREYADEAMALLGAAHQRKRVELERLRGSSFDAIRDRADFRQLVDALSR